MKLTKKQYLRNYYLKNREHMINYGKNYYKVHGTTRKKKKIVQGLKKYNEKVIIYFD